MAILEILSTLASPITEAGKWLIDGLKQQISFLRKYKENLETLRSQACALEIKRSDVLTMVEDARRRGEDPYNEVAEWLRSTDNIQRTVANLNDEGRVNKRCFKDLCPDLCSRLHLSKDAIKILSEVICLQEKGNFTHVSRKRPPPGVERVHVDWVEGFPSRDAIMNEVIEALRNENISSVAVYGMGGNGKTTLMKSLNNKLLELEEKLFSIVIMVTVSQDPKLKDIQDNIGSRLGLKLEPQDSEVTRANTLLDRLKLEEKVLFILDDVWKQLDASKVGIPCDSEHKGSKFIITTRNLEVCIGMKIQSRIEMKLLSEIESWNLFEEKAGNVVTLPSVKPTAEEIVRRCKGSPLAIVVLGSSLCEVENIGRWRHALNVLENPYPGGVQGVLQEVATPLRYSYDNLHGPEIKLCFLFCCLFPEDYNIELSDLRNYGIAEGFLNANGGSLERASDELVDYIEKLKNRCLLLNGDKEGYVKMHDVVRSVAIWIGSEDENGFRVNIGPALGNWSEVEKLKSYKRISFMKFENRLDLSVPSECEQLQLRSLLVRENEFDRMDDDESFLDKMKALVLLDMRNINVPESVAHLTNLKALFLVDCRIRSSVDMFGRMTNLEILCLRGLRIDDGNCLEGIGNLTKLKCLDLTDTDYSAVAWTCLEGISRLLNLEELLGWNTALNNDRNWGVELPSLVHLSRLEVQLTSDKFNAHSFPWKSLKQFRVGIDYYQNNFVIRIILGRMRMSSIIDNSSSGRLYLGNMNPVTHWVSSTPLPMMTQALRLTDCTGFNNMLDFCDIVGFKRLEYLYLEELPELKSICQGTLPNGSLENLQFLDVTNCRSLEFLITASAAKELRNLEELSVYSNYEMENLVLWRKKEEDEEGEITSTSSSRRQPMSITTSPPTASPCFQNLQKLNITYCHRLKKIFSFRVALGLQKLVSIYISRCSKLECMIGKDEEETELDHYQSGLLPQLQSLELCRLPRLTSIYQGNLPLCSPNLKPIVVRDCPNLKITPLGSEC